MLLILIVIVFLLISALAFIVHRIELRVKKLAADLWEVRSKFGCVEKPVNAMVKRVGPFTDRWEDVNGVHFIDWTPDPLTPAAMAESHRREHRLAAQKQRKSN